MFPKTAVVLALLVLLISYLIKEISEMNKLLLEKDESISEKDKLLNDPDFNKRQAMMAFNEAEEWRLKKVAEIYHNVSNDELDLAVRWIEYATPFADSRSCTSTVHQWSNSIDLNDMWEKMQLIASPDFFWNDTCRKNMLSLHSHHTTGIEGNTLTLSETILVIDDKPLIAGFSSDGQHFLTPVSSNSLDEVKNIQRILNALQFSSPPVLSGNKFMLLNKQLLVDINAAILGKSSSFRDHAVSIGHQKIVLPMPDEVNHLLDLYLEWVNSRWESFLRNLDDLNSRDILLTAISLACDAHTKFVHIHPFSDGNGRLARILSGLILRPLLLPPPLFIKEGRHAYIKAVGQTTIYGNTNDLCLLHAEAVNRSMNSMITLSKNGCSLT